MSHPRKEAVNLFESVLSAMMPPKQWPVRLRRSTRFNRIYVHPMMLEAGS